MQIIVLCAIALIALGFVGARKFLRLEKVRLDGLDEFSRKFSEKMRRLLSANVQWEDWILADLNKYNKIASSREHIFPLLMALQSFKKQNNKNVTFGYSRKDKEEFFAQYPELWNDYIMVKFYAIVMLCYSSAAFWPQMIRDYLDYLEHNPSEAARFAEYAQRLDRWPSAVWRHAR
jgi:hypothetical protein